MFTENYLRDCQNFSAGEIVKYLDDFRALTVSSVATAPKNDKSRLISMRVEERLLETFRKKAGKEGYKYQTKLKELMRSYILETSDPDRRKA